MKKSNNIKQQCINLYETKTSEIDHEFFDWEIKRSNNKYLMNFTIKSLMNILKQKLNRNQIQSVSKG